MWQRGEKVMTGRIKGWFEMTREWPDQNVVKDKAIQNVRRLIKDFCAQELRCNTANTY